MIFSVFQKKLVFGYSWSTLLLYRCYYPHRSRDALSPICGIFLLLLGQLLLKAQFYLVPADILKNHDVHPVPTGKWSDLPGFSYLCPNKFFLHHKYAKKGFYIEFALQGSFVAILWINEVGGTCEMNIQMALKSRSYILDLDHMKSSLGIFFFLSCLMECLLRQLSGSTFIFVKNTHQKSSNLMFCLTLPVAKGSIQCCEL